MKKIAFISLLLILAACGSSVQSAKSELEDPVNVGFGRMVERKNVTTSISTIDSDATTQYYRDIYDMIEGKCAGVEVEGHRVRIRGAGKNGGKGDPLFVVNNVPTSDVSSISPYDVKSITVLKDAASCAIYGIEGANGVILIDLK